MGKINIALIILLISGCSTMHKKKLTFKDCVYKCIEISRDNDIDDITKSEKANAYLIYLCGTACREKSDEKEWTDFNKMFEIKQDKVMI